MLRIIVLMVSLLAALTGTPTVGIANPSTSVKTTALPPDKVAEKERNQAVIDMAEKRLGVIVLPVTEDIKKEINLRAAEGVAGREKNRGSGAEGRGRLKGGGE